MFLRHQVEVGLPFPDVAPRLAELFEDHGLHRLSRSAYQHGRDVLLQVGPFGAVPALSKQVRIRRLPSTQRDGLLSTPIRWEATGGTSALFPVLDADLLLASAGSVSSTLTLLGSYRVPLGRLGGMIDATLLWRVATATITVLLDQLSATLHDPVPQDHTTAPTTTPPGRRPRIGPAARVDEAGLRRSAH